MPGAVRERVVQGADSCSQAMGAARSMSLTMLVVWRLMRSTAINATLAVPCVRRIERVTLLQTCGRVTSTMQGCVAYGDGSETLTGWWGVFTINDACRAGAALPRKLFRKIQNRVVSK